MVAVTSSKLAEATGLVIDAEFKGVAGTGLDEIIGGWQLSGLGRWTSALPFSVVDTRGFTNNFLFNDFMVQTGPVRSGLFHVRSAVFPALDILSGPERLDSGSLPWL